MYPFSKKPYCPPKEGCPRSKTIFCPVRPVDQVPQPNNVTPYANQFTVWEHLTLPDGLPDIKELKTVDRIEVCVTAKKVVPTPAVTATDGTVFTGRKLCFEGYVDQTIQYCDHGGHVYCVDFQFPFSAYIIIPDEINGTDPLQIHQNNIIIDTYVECCALTPQCGRNIFKNVVIFAWAKFMFSDNGNGNGNGNGNAG
ncbi:hypothetical protein [Heliorestis convoluta]|uniref:SipL SPOCS domain-containing protein n=1 Tax=Heliorestis convoluta TaxID=356322 RepID=A0A5Q2N4L7_9FIRM|nr:hypothetical protein [Heliorestis convoluta]QGG48829.1 hypothetical protein FTV88_2740 [Heliorestis convoluta]